MRVRISERFLTKWVEEKEGRESSQIPEDCTFDVVCILNRIDSEPNVVWYLVHGMDGANSSFRNDMIVWFNPLKEAEFPRDVKKTNCIWLNSADDKISNECRWVRAEYIEAILDTSNETLIGLLPKVEEATLREDFAL